MRQLVEEKENSEFKPVELRLKIELVSYPARAEGLGKYDKLHLENHKKTLEREINKKRKNLNKDEKPEKDFKGDALSPLLFKIIMTLPNYIHRKCTGGYKFTKSQEKINNPHYVHGRHQAFRKE